MKFKISELLKTGTGLQNTPNNEELENIEFLISFLNERLGDWPDPIIVTSGFRSEAVNRAVGGVPTSHHRTGHAVDLTTKNLDGLLRKLKENLGDIDQLIHYPSRGFIHVSIKKPTRGMFLTK